MVFFSHATVAGKLTDDPRIELCKGRSDGSPLARCELHLVADQEAYSRHGEKLHIRAVLFGQAATIVGKHRKKGDYLLVAGRLLSRIFVGKDGQRRHHIYIVAENFSFLWGPTNRFRRGHAMVPQPEYERLLAVDEAFGAMYSAQKVQDLLSPPPP